MKEILKRIEGLPGVKSGLVMTSTRSLAEAGLGRFDLFTLHAAHGKAVFACMDGAFLVVLLDQFADLDGCRAEIQGTVQRLRRQSRMSRE